MSVVQTASEAMVLALFDQLLDLGRAARCERLADIASDDPLLHARLSRMLAAATDGTRVLAEPVLNGLRSLQSNAVQLPGSGATVSGYRLVRELGRGGMSSVWLAERSDGIVKRPVALKLPLVALRSALDIARFEQERDVLASLAHPHIARLYDAGVTGNGQPFIVLEYIDGVPITRYCDTHGLGLRQRLELFLQVLAAVGHAHKHMTVHRDLKPSNILVDTEGQVKLLDFGIAKLLSEPTDTSLPQTQLGTAALTPMYSAPEQVAQLPISTLTDVYVLGLVLYELLTGMPAHATSADALPSLEQVLQAQLHGLDRPPSRAPLSDQAARVRDLPDTGELRRRLKGDLDTIVQKALQHAPEQRYCSTEHFAEDLRRFLQQRPITARPARLRYLAGLFLRRHRATSISVACGVMISIVALAVAAHQYLELIDSEARTTAVNKFVFNIFYDTEPDELQAAGSCTSKTQLLDSAVPRAQQQLQRQPRLHGEILSEIGRVYRRCHQLESGERALVQALSLLQSTAPADDPALNKTLTQLAFVELEKGNVARARDLATTVRDHCRRRDLECAKARAAANAALSQIHTRDGQPAASLAALRESVLDTEQGFGAAHEETALAWMSLAMLARNSGQLGQAAAAMQRASTIAGPHILRAQDRRELLRADAVIQLDLGRYEAARTQLQRLLDDSTQPSERATLLRLLANVALEQGSLPEAAALAGNAVAQGDPQRRNMESFFALQALARAHALMGQSDAASSEIHTVLDGLSRLKMTQDSTAMLRAQRVKAEILLRRGDFLQASSELEAVIARLHRNTSAADVDLGQALDLLGCALRALGRSSEALDMHQRARAHLQKQLPDDHPFLRRNALYREAATEDWDGFRSRAEQLGKTFKPGSIWKKLLDEVAALHECRSGASRPCTFVL